MNDVDCNSVLEQLSDYIDSEAREELCKEIAAHMSRCHDCRIMVDSVKKTIVLYQSGASTEVPMRATAELMAALSREYDGGKGTGRGD